MITVNSSQLAAAWQGWEMPKEFTAIQTFMQKISERDSWKKTCYTEKYVHDGWKLKVKLLTEG